MNQTRLQSLIETACSTSIGYVVAIASQLVIFPMFDIHIELSTNFAIGAWFTVVSVARGYIVRRWFNARLHKFSQRTASKLAGDK